MNFKSFADLSLCIKENLYRIPHDVDVVVGIPRSGLLVACIIALDLNIPVVDLDSFLQGKIPPVGRTRSREKNVKTALECKKVLIVDDSVNSGKTLYQVKEKLLSLDKFNLIKFIFMAVYASEEGVKHIDLYLEFCPKPRYFEWNIMHSDILKSSCVDIDGVLCREPSPEENDDGERYIEFLTSSDPMFLPSQKIGFLVTCRLEKYRDYTEAWLRKNGINYDNLLMMPYQSKRERVEANRYSEFKAEVYLNSGTELFIESSLKQASQIFALTEKPVLCVENFQLIGKKQISVLGVSSKSSRGNLGLFISRNYPYLYKLLKGLVRYKFSMFK